MPGEEQPLEKEESREERWRREENAFWQAVMDLTTPERLLGDMEEDKP